MPGERALNSLNEIRHALYDLPRLTRDELDKVRCSLQHLAPYERDRYFSELFFLLGDDLLLVQSALNENRSATEHFDQSSRKLTRWLIGLTVVLIVLTLVIAGFTILLWKRT